MTAVAKPSLPKGLGASGRRLWRSVVDDLPQTLELDPRELALLDAAARQADSVAALEAAVRRDGFTVVGSAGQPRVHPAVAEARLGRVALSRLLGELKLPAGEDARPMSSGAKRAQHAADVRWSQHRARKALRSA